MFLLSFFKKYKFVLLISLFLFIAPFFWLKPGEVDLGGDANRLYFYDPINFLKSTALYGVAGEGKGIIEPKYSYLPYVSLIAILKTFISSTAIISFFNGMKLAVGFITVYLIVFEFLKNAHGINKKFIHMAGVLSGVFYTVSFGSFNMSFFWDRALFTHDQIFLNPLLLYLLLKFILTNVYKYLWIAVLISFVFSTNFSLLASAPPMFAFYPLAVIFLLFYAKIFGKKTISWKGVGVGVLLFLGIHAFHLLGEAMSFFDSGSNANSIVFSKEGIENEGVLYFNAVHQYGRAILNLFIPSEKQFFGFASLIGPLVVILGFLLNIGRKKELLFISAFFVITFFLVTANITDAGFELYKKLFYIPGFAMFRNFYTQWMYIFIFFYSILFGFSIYGIFLRLKPFYSKALYVLVFVLLALPGIPLFMGEPVNKSIIRGSNNVRGVIAMDPKYEQVLAFIRSLPDDGKILVLPLTDFFRQVVYGRDGGTYEGPSTLLHLTDKYSFVGYQHFGYKNRMPYAEDIMRYSREKDYDRLLRIFTVLNIRYIFHNTDPKVYEENFSKGSSYQYMQTSMPKTQDAYKDFVREFPVRSIYKNDPYVIYEIDKSEYNSTIFVPDGVYQSNTLSFDRGKNHSVFIDGNTCDNPEFKNLCTNYKKPNADIKFSMINPTLYSVSIRQHEPVESILLVMQHTYHNGWKLVLDDKYIAKNSHILVNGYANGWFISSKNLPKGKDYKLFIKLDPQKYFWYGWTITLASLVLAIGLLISSFRKSYEKN